MRSRRREWIAKGLSLRKDPKWRWLLFVLSYLYLKLIQLRHFCYDHHLFAAYHSNLPVISVGNIAVGGTGKTPLVELLVHSITGRVGILSRGYKAAPLRRPLIVSYGKGPIVPVDACGDEPYLLAQHTHAFVAVFPHRAKLAALAESHGVEWLLLDDGMQHRKLHRDFEIVVLHGLDPLGEGDVLPLGRLRDDPQRLRSADLIVITHIRDRVHYDSVCDQIAPYITAPCVGVRYCFEHPEWIAGQKVAAFCGIGSPEQFFSMIEESGGELVATLELLDHEAISPLELRDFVQKSCHKGASRVVCTEKDRVKLRNALPEVCPLALRVEIVFGRPHWERALATIEQLKFKR